LSPARHYPIGAIQRALVDQAACQLIEPSRPAYFRRLTAARAAAQNLGSFWQKCTSSFELHMLRKHA
jgi:hypothetical protein